MRLWRYDGGRLRVAGGPKPAWPAPDTPKAAGLIATPNGPVWLEPVAGSGGCWLEVGGGDEATMRQAAVKLLPVIGALLDAEWERALVAEELANRYEEIDLLYAINEILGRTARLEEATRTIAREVSAVVGARRASIMVADEATGTLRVVAARGFGTPLEPVRVDDAQSVAARAFREQRIVVFDPIDPGADGALRSEESEARGYKGEAYLSVPICYGAPGTPLRCIGVINLTDRIGGDRFTPSDRKLVVAVANQIGAAIENARLVDQERRQEQLRRELELAHDLQLKLLPSPAVLQGDAVLAARCLPADSVGGDFYTFTRLGGGRVGVMLGDVASHGFSAALVMALVMAAAGIHAAASATPDETLTALVESLSTELSTTEMHFSVFYGMLDPVGGHLTYSNAGHPHAFRIPPAGDAERLIATSPPLGLATVNTIQRRQVPWTVGADLLCLWTDGLVDARNEAGECYGETRLLAQICARRHELPETIVEDALADAAAFGGQILDDRTLLILRI